MKKPMKTKMKMKRKKRTHNKVKEASMREKCHSHRLAISTLDLTRYLPQDELGVAGERGDDVYVAVAGGLV